MIKQGHLKHSMPTWRLTETTIYVFKDWFQSSFNYGYKPFPLQTLALGRFLCNSHLKWHKLFVSSINLRPHFETKLQNFFLPITYVKILAPAKLIWLAFLFFWQLDYLQTCRDITERAGSGHLFKSCKNEDWSMGLIPMIER